MIYENQDKHMYYLGEKANHVVSRRLSPVKQKHESERYLLPKNPLPIHKQLEILKGGAYVNNKRNDRENVSDVDSVNGYNIDSDDGRGLRNMLKRQ